MIIRRYIEYDHKTLYRRQLQDITQTIIIRRYTEDDYKMLYRRRL